MAGILGKIKESFNYVFAKFFKGSILSFVLTLILFCLSVLVLYMIVRYWDGIILAVPGVINHDEYNELTDKKNDIVSENSELLALNSEYEVTLGSLESDDYAGKLEVYEGIISNLQKIIDNLETMVDYGDDFSEMQLPVYVSRYTELSKELDELRLKAAQISLSITKARVDLNELNRKRSNFDLCLNNISWNSGDAEIEKKILSCVSTIDDTMEYIVLLESKYEIDLTDIKNYFTLLGEQWMASASYYSALSKEDYMKANDYDAVFAEKRREIEGLDLNEVFETFSEFVITPKSDEFAKVSQQITEKQEDVDNWYEEYMENEN